MRLLNDCTIVKVDDQFGTGIQVWNATGMLFFGRFQATGMKIEGIGKARGDDKVNLADKLVLFTDDEHQDACWESFRDTMLHQHRVYIPDDLHVDRDDKGPIMTVLRFCASWLHVIGSVLTVFLALMLWRSGEPVNTPAAIAFIMAALIAWDHVRKLRKGRV